MIRNNDKKNSTEIFSTDHGSMWRTIRRTLRARTFGALGAFFGASESGSSRNRRRGGTTLSDSPDSTGGAGFVWSGGLRVEGRVRRRGRRHLLADLGASTCSTSAGNVAVLPMS